MELTWSIGPFDPPDPVLLYLTLPFEMLLGTVERQEAVLEFLRTVAGDANPAGGEVSYRPPEPMTTPLVHLFRGIKGSPKADTSAYLCRKWVRGYSWVTILAEELGQRLGGFEALQSSGAFYRVEHLAAGGFFLQATERFEQYQQEQGERVFATLAPVLPPFTPGTGRTPEDRWPRAPDPGYMVVHRHPSTVTEQRSSEGG